MGSAAGSPATISIDQALDGGLVMGRAPAPEEGALVGLGGDAVELDRLLDAPRREIGIRPF